MKNRCNWIQDKPDYYLKYHDEIWGKPEHNDQILFQWLSLEIFHIGLSWQLVLSKMDAFLMAFDQFNIDQVAKYDDEKVEELLKNSSIIRHRGKISAVIQNAQMIQKIQEEFGSFNQYLWGFTEGKIMDSKNYSKEERSKLSKRIVKDLKQRGIRFMGEVTFESYLEGIGMINAHDLQCSFR